MIDRWLQIAVLTLGVVLWPGQGVAQTVCGKHADIVKRLVGGYQEHQSSAGIIANGNLLEVFASKEGDWTIIVTKPGGMTCLVAVGEKWMVNRDDDNYGMEGQLL